MLYQIQLAAIAVVLAGIGLRIWYDVRTAWPTISRLAKQRNDAVVAVHYRIVELAPAEVAPHSAPHPAPHPLYPAQDILLAA